MKYIKKKYKHTLGRPSTKSMTNPATPMKCEGPGGRREAPLPSHAVSVTWSLRPPGKGFSLHTGASACMQI